MQENIRVNPGGGSPDPSKHEVKKLKGQFGFDVDAATAQLAQTSAQKKTTYENAADKEYEERRKSKSRIRKDQKDSDEKERKDREKQKEKEKKKKDKEKRKRSQSPDDKRAKEKRDEEEMTAEEREHVRSMKRWNSVYQRFVDGHQPNVIHALLGKKTAEQKAREARMR